MSPECLQNIFVVNNTPSHVLLRMARRVFSYYYIDTITCSSLKSMMQRTYVHCVLMKYFVICYKLYVHNTSYFNVEDIIKYFTALFCTRISHRSCTRCIQQEIRYKRFLSSENTKQSSAEKKD